MGTVYTVLRDYSTNLKAIQHVARMWSVSTGDYETVRPSLTAALTNTRSQLDILRPAIQATTLSDDYKAMVDAMLMAAFDETTAIVVNPRDPGTMGKFGVTAPQVESSLQLAERLGRSLLKLLYFVAGVAVVTVAYTKLSPLLFDPNGTKAAVSVWTDVQKACVDLRAACPAGDAECLRVAEAQCAELRKQSLEDVGEGSCGLLSTPYGTVIGLMLGIGFGWAGLRKVMSL